ncbi:MAG: molecular chaperone [Gammaproteobacteria bacterium]|nr:molecular chaperone [Gammaproteobacteria bacterium]
MKNYLLPALAALLLAFATTSTALAFGVGLTPSTVELEVQPGSRHRQVLRVKNFNPDKPIRLTISVADWTLDETGQVQLTPPEESERSASAWVNFSPSVLLLEPNATQEVIVDINTPLNLDKKGDHRSALILSTVLPSKEKRAGTQGVWNRYQIASLFYANVMPGKSEAKITQATVHQPDARKGYGLTFKIENAGERHVRMEGTVALQDQTKKRIAEQPFQAVLLNDQAREFSVEFDDLNLQPGDYDVLFDIKGEGKTIPLKVATSPVLSLP